MGVGSDLRHSILSDSRTILLDGRLSCPHCAIDKLHATPTLKRVLHTVQYAVGQVMFADDNNIAKLTCS